MGRMSRVFSVPMGAYMTFASLESGQESANGQIPIDRMKELTEFLSVMKINQHTQLYGVIGNPVRHSLSPSMHNAAFKARGINAAYLAFEVSDLEGCLKGVRSLGVKGLSVTIPFKEEIIPLLDEVDPLAKGIGAVNTVVNEADI